MFLSNSGDAELTLRTDLAEGEISARRQVRGFRDVIAVTAAEGETVGPALSEAGTSARRRFSCHANGNFNVEESRADCWRCEPRRTLP